MVTKPVSEKYIPAGILRTIRIIATRAMVIYVVLILLSQSVVDHNTISFGLKMRIISKLMPTSFTYLVDINNAAQRADPQRLLPYKTFYEHIIAYFPDRTDAYTMLGFCYAAIGRTPDAIALYKKAHRLKPDYFWTNYNLGLLFFKKGDYAAADTYLTYAVNASSADTTAFIEQSKVVFRSILIDDPQFGADEARRFIIAQRNAYHMLTLAKYNQKDLQGMAQIAHHAADAQVGRKDLFLYFAGFAAYSRGDFGLAVTCLEDALRKNPQFPDALILLGMSVAKIGDAEKAGVFIDQGKQFAASGVEGVPSIETFRPQLF